MLNIKFGWGHMPKLLRKSPLLKMVNKTFLIFAAEYVKLDVFSPFTCQTLSML